MLKNNLGNSMTLFRTISCLMVLLSFASQDQLLARSKKKTNVAVSQKTVVAKPSSVEAAFAASNLLDTVLGNVQLFADGIKKTAQASVKPWVSFATEVATVLKCNKDYQVLAAACSQANLSLDLQKELNAIVFKTSRRMYADYLVMISALEDNDEERINRSNQDINDDLARGVTSALELFAKKGLAISAKTVAMVKKSFEKRMTTLARHLGVALIDGMQYGLLDPAKTTDDVAVVADKLSTVTIEEVK